ncbi:MAG: class I SAM-dependent methyltransferase [Pirellulaceae bacterium]
MSAGIQKSRDQLHQGEIEFFSKYYESQNYNTVGWDLRLRRELKSLLRRAGSQPLGRVLSLGCGDGQFEIMLAQHAEHVTGLDLSPEAIEVARRKAQQSGCTNAEFACQPLEDLEWNQTYDTIVVLATLHHVPESELPSMMATIYKHLTPGGLFYSQDPNRKGLLRSIGRVVLGKKYDKYHSPDERELDPSNIRATLNSVGFQDVRIGHIDAMLIPGLFMFPRKHTPMMHAFLWFDKVWCSTPLKHWSSGFNASGRKPKLTA